MKKAALAALAASLTASLIPVGSAHAFSDGFKQTMTDVQTRVMVKGDKVSPADLKQWWSKYDDEVIAILSNAKKPVEDDLNKETEAVELNETEKKGTEIDDIELGKIGVSFHKLDTAGKLWLAVLTNSMYSGSTPLPYSTIHFYKEVDGKFQRVGALDEMTGPWDKDKIQFSTVQFQPMGTSKGAIKFATFHAWPVKGANAKPNRSQMIWEFKDAPKITLIVPEVDWHTDGAGNVVPGRGEAYDVP